MCVRQTNQRDSLGMRMRMIVMGETVGERIWTNSHVRSLETLSGAELPETSPTHLGL